MRATNIGMPSALTLPFALQVPLILNQTFDPGFHIDLHCKDLHLGYEIGRKFGVPLELFGLVQQTYLKAMYKYGGTAGSTHPARLIQDTLSELPALVQRRLNVTSSYHATASPLPRLHRCHAFP